jgi:LmbE family N-acetylglucosaminyl deacetylase
MLTGITGSENLLIVGAHPDDEVLGFGAAGAVLAKKGVQVTSCFLSGDVDVRKNRPEIEVLHDQSRSAQKILGFQEPIFGPFPNIQFNTVPHIELVQFVEKAIEKTQADIVVTHHPGDPNNDHLHVARACCAAVRVHQRDPEQRRVSALYFMEVSSSTDWALDASVLQFRPDTYFDVSQSLHLKLDALACYSGVMRDAPHPRSRETLQALARVRGSQAGFEYAEAVQTALRLLANDV